MKLGDAEADADAETMAPWGLLWVGVAPKEADAGFLARKEEKG